MERYYQIAGICYRVTGRSAWMPQDDGVLTSFRVECAEEPHTVALSVCHGLSAPEGQQVFSDGNKEIYSTGDVQTRYEGIHDGNWENGYLRIRRDGMESQVQIRADSLKGPVGSKLILGTMELEHHVVERGGILFHAAYIEHEGGAILFTAPSGTGKSTQAELWCRHRGAVLINGDRCAVMLTEKGAVVHGVPYSGSSRVRKNRSLPLRGIVYLSQAPENRIRRLVGLRAFRSVWEGCCLNTWSPEAVDRCAQTVTELVQRIPVWHLACLPEESAVTELERVIYDRRKS